MPIDELHDQLYFHIYYLVHHATVPGKIETVNIVVDVTGIQLKDFPITDLYALC